LCAVSTASVCIGNIGGKCASPDNHFRASPHCGVEVPRGRRVVKIGGCPGISCWVISSACVQILKGFRIESAPDNHFVVSPDGSVPIACIRYIIDAGWRDDVRTGKYPARFRAAVDYRQSARSRWCASGPCGYATAYHRCLRNCA